MFNDTWNYALGKSRGVAVRVRRGMRATRKPVPDPIWTERQRRGDTITWWVGPQIQFLHLEKTGGTALSVHMSRRFHPAQIAPDLAGMQAAAGSVSTNDRFPDLTTETRWTARQTRLLCGHYDLPALREISGDLPKYRVTVLREPRARLLSLYNYWRAITNSTAPEIRIAQTHDLRAFLAHPDPIIRNAIDNLYVRRLTGLYADAGSDPFRTNPDAALSHALKSLGHFDRVGVSEDMDSLGRHIAHDLDVKGLGKVPRLNALASMMAKGHPGIQAVEPAPIAPEAEALLAFHTRFDRIVYDAVRQAS